MQVIASPVTPKVSSSADAVDFVCPRDGAALVRGSGDWRCDRCRTVFPTVRGVPVLIDDERSVFSREEFREGLGYEGAAYGQASDRSSGLRRAYRAMAAKLASRAVYMTGFDAHGAAMRMRAERPQGRILVIGAGDMRFPTDRVVYTDVAFSDGLACICDAHSLPFPDGYFDGVMAVAVLEHVADPQRCVAEIHRVLSADGLVYAATPFLQPVHMGAHDFTRFTYLGHRRLFRSFDDIDSGPVLGPATSLAYVAQHVLLSFSDRAAYRRIAKLAGLVLAVLIKQLDRLFRNRIGAYDAAAGFYFFGSKRASPIADREILRLYRGGQ